MTKKPAPPPPDVEHRAPDQDAAIEAAFVEGTLPEEDRRSADDGMPVPSENLDAIIPRAEALRLLAIAEQDTGYVQASALKALRALVEGV